MTNKGLILAKASNQTNNDEFFYSMHLLFSCFLAIARSTQNSCRKGAHMSANDEVEVKIAEEDFVDGELVGLVVIEEFAMRGRGLLTQRPMSPACHRRESHLPAARVANCKE